MRRTAIALVISAFSALAVPAAVEVRFAGGGSMIVEAVEMRDGQAILTLTGGGTLALSAKRISSYREVPSGESAPAPDGAAATGESARENAPVSPATSGSRLEPSADAVAPSAAGDPGAERTEISPLEDPPPSGAAAPSAAAPAIPDLIQEASIRYGVDAELLRCLIEVESGYDPLAVSSKGAMGLGQLMPGTAKDLGVSNPFDPAEAVDAAARHLSELLRRSGGRFVPALAAYNAGQGAVNRYGGVPPYRETIRYIEKILERYATK